MSLTLVIIIIAAISLAIGIICGICYKSVSKGIGGFVIGILVAGFIALTIWAIHSAVSPPKTMDEYTVELVEMEDGIYAYQSEVVSRVPAENYSMLTVCDKSGNVISIKGNVEIVFQDTKKPYAKIVDRNIINSDTIIAYVPSGSVIFNGATSVH